MKITVANVKPHDNLINRTDKLPVIDSNHMSTIQSTFFAKRFIDTLEDTPANRLNANTPVTIQGEALDDNGQIITYDLTADNIREAYQDWFTNNSIEPDMEEQLRSIFQQTSQRLPINTERLSQQLALNYLNANQYPAPSNTIIYQFSVDIQNQLSDFLANNSDANYNNLLLGLTGYYFNHALNDNTLIIGVKSQADFKDIVNQAHAEMSQATTLTSAMQDIQTDVTNGIFDVIESYNFNANEPAIAFIKNVINDDENTLVVPTNMYNMSETNTLTILNFEKLNQISGNKEFESLNRQAVNDIHTAKAVKKFAKISKIKRASVQARHAQPQSQKADKKVSGIKQSNNVHAKRTHNVHKTRDYLNQIYKLVKNRVTKMKSENTFKVQTPTYQRASRRFPDDPNIKGLTKKTMSNPDVHIYLDTSGSISESQYANAIYTIVLLSQRMKSDIYFTSFSHYIAQTVKINVHGKTAREVYKQIQKIPKAAGGTEFENVYEAIDTIDKINRKKYLAPRLNFIITDFEYDFSQTFTFNNNRASVKNTFYMPIDTKNQNIARYMNDFARSARLAKNHSIDKHML